MVTTTGCPGFCPSGTALQCSFCALLKLKQSQRPVKVSNVNRGRSGIHDRCIFCCGRVTRHIDGTSGGTDFAISKETKRSRSLSDHAPETTTVVNTNFAPEASVTTTCTAWPSSNMADDARERHSTQFGRIQCLILATVDDDGNRRLRIFKQWCHLRVVTLPANVDGSAY